MKRFFQTGFFFALKETQNSNSKEWERMYDEFCDFILENALTMDKETYCHTLNRILVELKFLQKGQRRNEKKFIILKRQLCW
jgi:hypothetical protein